MKSPKNGRVQLRQSDAALFKLVLKMVRDKLKWMEVNFGSSKRRRRRKKKEAKKSAKKKEPQS
jgi:hypothetical protein